MADNGDNGVTDNDVTKGINCSNQIFLLQLFYLSFPHLDGGLQKRTATVVPAGIPLWFSKA